MTREEAIAEIKEKTPKLLEDYRALANALKPILGITDEEADLPEMDPAELAELYEAVAEFAEGYDIDSIDMLMEQTKGYAIPAAEKDRFARLTQAVRDSDWDAVKEVCRG